MREIQPWAFCSTISGSSGGGAGLSPPIENARLLVLATVEGRNNLLKAKQFLSGVIFCLLAENHRINKLAIKAHSLVSKKSVMFGN